MAMKTRIGLKGMKPKVAPLGKIKPLGATLKKAAPVVTSTEVQKAMSSNAYADRAAMMRKVGKGTYNISRPTSY